MKLCNWWRGLADSKRHSLQAVDKLLCKWCRTLPLPAMVTRYTVFLAGAAPHKSGWCRYQSRFNNSIKRVLICDICYKQIHVRKQISIMCNRIEHWGHLRSSSIRQAQDTYTWTCHLHWESRLTTHTDITPRHPSRHWSKQWVTTTTTRGSAVMKNICYCQDNCS